MRTITQTYNVYTIDTHPEPEKVYEWINSNWHDLGGHVLEDAVASLKAFAEALRVKVDWSLCIFPDRGEYIRFQCDFGDEFARNEENLRSWLAKDCPFTGMYYDEVILDAFREAGPADTLDEVLRDVEHRVLKAIHDEGEYLYSEDGLRDMCEANEYEFTEDGAFH